MSTHQPQTECEIDDSEEIDCWNCEDKGFTVTVGGIQMPCPDCKTGDLFFYHKREERAPLTWPCNPDPEDVRAALEREKTLEEMVHVDDYLPGVDPEYDEEDR